jgi:HK97 gp10 family phage protein
LSVRFTDNSAIFLRELEAAKRKALETIGQKAEGYAKKLCPVGTPESTGIAGYRGGTLRNSITHRVENGDTMALGSNVEYAPYVELGTGPHFQPPPEWEQFTTERGSGVGKAYVKPRPYIRPAIEDHRNEYEDIARKELEG